MMRSKKILFIVLIAFASGFLLNEYRHRQLVEQSLADKTVPASHNISSTLPTADAVQKVANPHASISGEKMTEPFSWVKVDQLIAGANYAEATRVLQAQMDDPKNAAHVWLVLATIYKKQSQAVMAVDAWYRYVRLEVDNQKINKALSEIKTYLLQLRRTPALFNEDYSWLIAQFEELLKYNANDGDLHLILADLLLQLKDNYQAQYHALMAVNDPAVQKDAELILAKLNGKNTPEEIKVPLVHFGNQYLVNVNVEGYPARLLLDTGASLSGLSSAYTAKYPFMIKAAKPIRLNTASGSRDSFLFTVTNISIENLVFSQHILAQLPMDNSQDFDGLLGADILGRFDFVIDQDANVLRLKARK